MKRNFRLTGWLITVAIIALFLVPMGCNNSSDSGSDSGTGTVTGTVRDHDGNLVEGVACSIDTGSEEESRETYTDTSDVNGEFQIDNVPAGTWNLTLSKTGFITTTVSVSVSDNSTTEVPENSTIIYPGGVVTPTPSPTASASPSPSPTGAVGTVEGYVKDSTGKAVEGASVTIDTGDKLKAIYSSITDASGYYTILNVPVGTWPMTVYKTGYGQINTTVQIQQGQTTTVPTGSTTVSPGGDNPGGGGGGTGNLGIQSWKWFSPAPQGNYQIRSAWGAGTTAIMVGQSGLFYRSTDSGATWTKENLGFNVQLNGVWGVGNNWYIVGNATGGRGLVLYSTNAGATWTQQTSATIPNVNLNGVYGTDAGTKVFIVGDKTGGDATVLYSALGDGTDWAEQVAGVNKSLYAVHGRPSNGTKVFAVGEANGGNGAVIYSALGDGSDWADQTATAGRAANFYGVWVKSDGSIAYLCGAPVGVVATLMRTANDGTAWTQCELAGPADLPDATLYSVWGNSAGKVFAGGLITGGATSAVLQSQNAGAADNWVNESGDGDVGAQEIHCARTFGDSYMLFGGNGGDKGKANGIILTSDNLTAWNANIPDNHTTWTQLNGISAADANNMIAVGNAVGGAGLTYVTANGGTAWTIKGTGINKNVYGVWNPTAGTAYAVGAADAASVRKYAGGNWGAFRADDFTDDDIYYGVHGYSETDMYVVGQTAAGKGVIYSWHTGDGKFKSATDNNCVIFRGVFCQGTADDVWVVGDAAGGNPIIRHYTTGDKTAVASYASAMGTGSTVTDNLKSVWANGTSVYAVGDNADGTGVLYVSKDYGTNWTRTTVADTPFTSVTGNTTTGLVWACGNDGAIYYYNGSAWVAYSSITIKDLKGIVHTGSGLVRAVGTFETIIGSVPPQN